MDSDNALILTQAEARVLGCLVEKAALTPETYPLTLNAAVVACNQKTSRSPLTATKYELRIQTVTHLQT